MTSPSNSPLIIPEDNRRAAIDMVAASFAFATMGCIAHAFKDQVAWSMVAFTRIVVTALISLLMLYLRRAPFLIKCTPALWWRSIFGSLGILCGFYALSTMPVTDTVTIMSTTPIWVTILLAVFFRQPVRLSTGVYALLALAGVYVMQRPSFDMGSFPIAIALLGSFIIATVKISLGYCRNLPPVSVVTHYALCASLVSLLITFIVRDGTIVLNTEMSPWFWLWLFPMGLAGTVGQLFMTGAYGKGKTNMVALVSISQIGFAALYDAVLWQRYFDLPKLIGVLMITIAIAATICTHDKILPKEVPASTIP